MSDRNSQLQQISIRLIRSRTNAGLKPAQVAKMIGLPTVSFQYTEDSPGNMPLGMLLALTEIYGVSICWLMTGQNPNFTEEHKAALMQNAQDKNIPMDEAADILDHLESLDQ